MILRLQTVFQRGTAPAAGIVPLRRAPLDAVWPCGEDGSIVVTIVDEAGDPVNVSGGSLSLGLRVFPFDAAPVFAPRAGVPLDPTHGVVAFFLVAADTSGLAPGRYQYDVWYVDSGGARHQVVPASVFELLPSNTLPGEDPSAAAPIPPIVGGAVDNVNGPTGTMISAVDASQLTDGFWLWVRDHAAYFQIRTDVTDPVNHDTIETALGLAGGKWVEYAGGSGGVGPRGPAGASGPPGQDGRDGEAGEPGPPGRDGRDGATGAAGAAGANGTNGAAGSPGTIGPPGFPGQDGEDGEMGLPGPAGPTGAPGAAGAAGALGAPGQDGVDGEDGVSIVGPRGPAGADGAAGTNGTNGTNGANGINGAAGAPGMDGNDGDDGWSIPGRDGANGANGAAGRDGIPGMDGVDGEDGLSIPGRDGVAGASGLAGMAGAPGQDGADGEVDLVIVPGVALPPYATQPKPPGFDIRFADFSNVFDNIMFWKTFGAASPVGGTYTAVGLLGAIDIQTGTGAGTTGSWSISNRTITPGAGGGRLTHGARIAVRDALTAGFVVTSGFNDLSDFGVYFRGDVNSANIQCICKNAGGTTNVDSGVAWATSPAGLTNYFHLEIVISPDGDGAVFYVNGAPKAVITTNLPVTALQQHIIHVNNGATAAQLRGYAAFARLRHDPA